MNELGFCALFLAWGFSLIGILSGAYAGQSENLKIFKFTRFATILVFSFCWLSLIFLGALFTTHDYSNAYVWQYSNRDMPVIYKISAIWGGMDGSMLLWAGILSISGLFLALKARHQNPKLLAWVLSAFNTSSFFFLTVTLFGTNPFRYLKSTVIPFDGNGLNPLLQNPYMAIHPPMLYSGFTTLAVPYAFCIGALLSGNLSNDWLKLTRTWTIVAWVLLTVGIVLGGHWAYLELGWGGFWAWDPVENASFFPWLTGTAFLHSVMVQERKNSLKLWNVALVVLTYALTVFGTFLTRSGVVQSVHAFADSDIGWIFLVYLAFIAISALILVVLRRKQLKSEQKIESFFSREAIFLLNNLILLSICFATIWGVMFAVFSESFLAEKQTLGIDYFNAVNVPLFQLLLLFMGIGPLIAWRKETFKNFKKKFLIPIVSAFFIAAILFWIGVRSYSAITTYSICWFVLVTILWEFHRSYKRNPESLHKHRSRYGGHIVHLGVVIVAIGITASMAHKLEQEFTLAKGEKFTAGRFMIELNDFREQEQKNYTALVADTTIRALSTGAEITKLAPELRVYNKNKETTSEVALRMGIREDIYLVLAGTDDTGSRAAFKIFINPLQIWLWIGVVVMVVGTLVVLFSKRKEI